ncbi:hypothetical protein FISHEDRAFT_64268 [Fistulina hepatica ATCC 64428]|uniref:Uncharacterized protein n=1 Tax=Fistulina hepatica ATCC 64428 TaxID=1128425 RepID=A0A0D7AKC3_9AGAR|nr:hypothetical protein FISHEDRAFT_64268 [Fistulina hepatica ATCC 64428]
MDNFGGKRNDVVDFGFDVDYSGQQWFQEPPPPRPPVTPQAPPATTPQFQPNDAVIEQNDRISFALSCAVNTAYANYAKFGQLGVLGWSSEFSELIDFLKEMGFKGNMFVTTRQIALQACDDLVILLKTKMKDIQMQIIVMYFSSQVARLRRFLDGGREWTDYPTPNFPQPSNYPTAAP